MVEEAFRTYLLNNPGQVSRWEREDRDFNFFTYYNNLTPSHFSRALPGLEIGEVGVALVASEENVGRLRDLVRGNICVVKDAGFMGVFLMRKFYGFPLTALTFVHQYAASDENGDPSSPEAHKGIFFE